MKTSLLHGLEQAESFHVQFSPINTATAMDSSAETPVKHKTALKTVDWKYFLKQSVWQHN